MAESDPRSLADLVRALAADIPDLVGKEVQLAKAEARRALDLLLAALGQLAVGAVIGIGAIGVGLAALVNGITAILVARGMELPLASTVAAASVTAIAAIAAGLFLWGAMRALRAAQASLDSSAATVAESAVSIMEKF